MRISNMGGSAKLVKKAVAPARRKGSFFLKSTKAALNLVKKSPVLLTRLNAVPLFDAIGTENKKKSGHPPSGCPLRFLNE